MVFLRSLRRSVPVPGPSRISCRVKVLSKSTQLSPGMKRSFVCLAAVAVGGVTSPAADAWILQPTLSTRSALFLPSLCPFATRQSVHTQVRLISESKSDEESPPQPSFKPGDSILVEVMSFGPLGASVDVVGQGHGKDDLIAETDPVLGQGLIAQREIQYFREARDYLDVVRGEVLPAFVERVRDDGKINVSLTVVGGKAKAKTVGKMILERLELDKTLPVGDKSPPDDITREFPGVSKSAFKKAVSALYKKGLVQPGPRSVTLMKETPK